MSVVQVKMKVSEEEATMKPQRPEDDAVVELALEPIHGIAKLNVSTVDVVGKITLKQRW